MANIKFSAFTNEAVDAATTQLVGYKVGDTSANYRYDVAQLKTALASDTIFTTSPTEVVPTGQVITLTDSLKFESVSGSAYGGWIFTPALVGAGANDYATITYGARSFVQHYRANEGWAFGGTNTTNSFHFNTGANTMSDGYAMRVHASTASPYGALILKGYSNSTDKTFIIQDSGANEPFSIQDDGVAKYSGQAYTEIHTGITNMTFDWNNGNVQSTTMGASTPTFTPSNPKAGATYILTLAQTGAVTVNWNSLVKWPAATAPTLSGAGKTDVITLICYDETGAGLYYGSSTLNFTT